MTYKNFRAGILAVVLVFGMTVVGCDSDPDVPDIDTRSDITSLNQVDGTWKGFYSETITGREMLEDEWDDDEAEELFGDLRITVSLEITLAINAAAGTASGTVKESMVFSGENAELIWALMALGLGGNEGVVLNEANLSITMTESFAGVLDLGDLAGVQINQDGTKMKMPADSIGDDSPEMIYIRQ